MLSSALTFLVIALIAAALGFGGLAGTASTIAQVLFFVFLVLFLISLIAPRFRPPVAQETARTTIGALGRGYRISARQM